MNTYDIMRKHINFRLAQANTSADKKQPGLKIRVIGTNMFFLIVEACSEKNGLFDLGQGVPKNGIFSHQDIHDIADRNGLAIAIKPVYGARDLDYYLTRSQHACVRVTQELN